MKFGIKSSSLLSSQFLGARKPTCALWHSKSSCIIILVLVAIWYCTSTMNAVSTQALVENYNHPVGQSSHLLHIAVMIGLTTMQLMFGLGLATMLSSKHSAFGIFYNHNVQAQQEDSHYEHGSSKSPKVHILVGTLHYVGTLCTNLGFAYGSASIVQAIKLLEPVETLLLTYAILGMVNPKRKFGSALFIVFGTMMLLTSKGTNKHVNTYTIIYSLLSGVSFSSRNVAQKVSNRTNTTIADAGFLGGVAKGIQNFVSITSYALIPAIISLVAVEIRGVEGIEGSIVLWLLVETKKPSFQAIAYHGLYNIASISVLAFVSAPTHSLLNVGKRVFLVLAAALVFQESLGTSGVLGLLIAGIGGVFYSSDRCFAAASSATATNREDESLQLPTGHHRKRISSATKEDESLPLPTGHRSRNKTFFDFTSAGRPFTSLRSILTVGGLVLLVSPFLVLNLRTGESHQSQGHSEAKSVDPPNEIVAVPFSAYALDEAGFITKHRSCKTTIIVHGGKWSDQPFDELVMDDIVGIGSDAELDNMLCVQIESTVAVLLSRTTDKLNLIQPDKAKLIIASLGSDIEIVDRKTVAMRGLYEPSSPAVRLARQKDGNYGNFVWQFGATRLFNPYTTKFLSVSAAESAKPSALVMASANALHLPNPSSQDYKQMKDHVNMMTNVVKKIDRPTIMLGIGIQAKFSDIEETKSVRLHDHQVALMQEIGNRNPVMKSVSVRGEFTETACENAGVHNCLSLGCPSLSISHERNLGHVLESKWSVVESKLSGGNSSLKIGIGLPALHDDKAKYAKIMNLLLAVCEDHDCHFIEQAGYDKSLLLNYAKDKVNVKNVHSFNEGVEPWFQFMHQLDFVVSTRIHGGMAGISNGIPTIVIPTDMRILELINAMKLPSVSFEDAMNKKIVSLLELMRAAKKDFIAFETNRIDRLIHYKHMIESVGLRMDPVLVEVLRGNYTVS